MHSEAAIKKNLDWKYDIFAKKLGHKKDHSFFIMVHENRVDFDGFPIVDEVRDIMVPEFKKRGWAILNRSQAPIEPKKTTKKAKTA